MWPTAKKGGADFVGTHLLVVLFGEQKATLMLRETSRFPDVLNRAGKLKDPWVCKSDEKSRREAPVASRRLTFSSRALL